VDGLADVGALMREKGVPGLSLAYCKDASSETVAKVWGVASRADDRPVTEGTVFRAGSLGKPVTAFAVLQLARQGRLDLDADVNSLLSSWRVPAVDGWSPVISARMLLAHVAGTSGWGDNRGYGDEGPPETLVEVLEGHGDTPPLTFHALPNVMWHYSSGGYHLLQLLVTDVTGASFRQAASELVLRPFGMSSTTFEAPLPQRFRAVAADGHVDGCVVVAGTNRDPAVAAQGMWTTPGDLIRLARAVNAKAAPEMLVGHPVEPRMGLGLFLNEETGHNWWSHSGSVPGFECLMGGVAEAGFGWAAMANSSSAAPVVKAVGELVSRLEGLGRFAMHDLIWEGIAAVIRMNQHHLAAAGTYRLASGLEVALTLTSPDQWGQRSIEVTLPGQQAVQLAPPFADGHWRVPGLEAVLVFEPPRTLRFLQAGREVIARRSPG
jgi:CubicO group peptidase (beta-lactamase class C family)